MRAEVDDYVDTKLANFEVVLDKTLAAVNRGREKLQRPHRRTATWPAPRTARSSRTRSTSRPPPDPGLTGLAACVDSAPGGPSGSLAAVPTRGPSRRRP